MAKVEHTSDARVLVGTYIRTLEGFAYMTVVVDLVSRRVVGCTRESPHAYFGFLWLGHLCSPRDFY